MIMFGKLLDRLNKFAEWFARWWENKTPRNAGKKALLLVACLSVSGCAHVRDWWDKLPADPTAPTEPGQPPAGDDAVPYANLRWNRGGANFGGAVRDPAVTITSATIHRGNVPVLVYAGTGLTVWPARESNINGIAAIFFDADGDGVYERGGKFDWVRSNAAPRPMQHVNHGYNNWDGYPASGTAWAYVITDASGRKRSNVVKGVWP
jgi:hypothetical protein